ncbi:ROK family protein [Leucobacter sp. HY1910]
MQTGVGANAAEAVAAEYVIAVDIGGTKTVVALVDRALRVTHAQTAPTPAREGAAAVVATVARLAAAALDAATLAPAALDSAAGSDQVEGSSPNPAPFTVCGVGIGTAGTVDPERGVIVASTDTMVGWAGTELARDVRADLTKVLAVRGVAVRDAVQPTTPLPVTVRNDVDAHAAGEFAAGAARGDQSVLVVAVGTGIGAGIILAGTPLTGAHHSGGDLAHVPVPGAEHLTCTCGRPGHLEAIASGLGILAHYRSLGGDQAVPDTREVAARARAGDPLAAQAITDAARALGRALAGAVAILDPDRVVLTGSVTGIGATLWDAAEAAFRAELTGAVAGTPLVAGELGGDAPLVGAAAAVWAQA